MTIGDDWVLLVVVIFLLAFIVFVEIRNFIERKGLLDRLMARDYGEYKHAELAKIKLEKEDDEHVPL